MSAVKQVFGKGLEHRITVYVPGTTSVDQELTEEEHAAYVNTTVKTLSELFGGATAQPAMGGWISDQGNLVTEPVTLVHSFAAELSVAQLQAVRQLAQSIARGLGQEAVAVVIDDAMNFVTG